MASTGITVSLQSLSLQTSSSVASGKCDDATTSTTGAVTPAAGGSFNHHHAAISPAPSPIAGVPVTRSSEHAGWLLLDRVRAYVCFTYAGVSQHLTLPQPLPKNNTFLPWEAGTSAAAAAAAGDLLRSGPKDFEFGGILGQGAYAKVYLAKHKATGVEYAIKVRVVSFFFPRFVLQ